jgi:tetratricopeptide (TPR) repeat protein
MDIIALNAKAVVLMQQGSFQEAISVFRTAIGVLLRPADDPHQQEVMDTSTDNVTPTLLSVRSVPLENSLFTDAYSYQDHHAFSLFDRPLVIDDAELAAASSVSGQDCTSAVVLFNTGLALQLQGRRDICSQQTSFKNALWFYRTAFEILERCSDSDDKVNCLVYLAVANNMGHIYSHFYETSKVQRCLAWLQTILEAVKDSEMYVLGDKYHPFRMNILIVHLQDAAAAAVA